ncbi:MAG: imelysin family protein, partial [Saprospiraceae bacterium]|nr:imelysin family protein [Saprospiraceae bacterium]
MHRLTITLLIILGLTIAACSDDEGPGGSGNPCASDFDQQALFQNLADNLIVPLFQNLQLDLNQLQTAVKSFTQDPDQTQLSIARSLWESAYLTYQRTGIYEFGPAETVFLRSSLNNFPVDTAQIEENVSTGIYDFSSFDSFDKGFPAMDYLLFGLGESDADIIAAYSTGDRAAAYGQYLQDMVADMKERVDLIVAEWVGGGYREEFIANTGTAAGTSLSLIVNNLNQYYEAIKR